jgi:hypothetical protein
MSFPNEFPSASPQFWGGQWFLDGSVAPVKFRDHLIRIHDTSFNGIPQLISTVLKNPKNHIRKVSIFVAETPLEIPKSPWKVTIVRPRHLGDFPFIFTLGLGCSSLHQATFLAAGGSFFWR